MIGRGYELGDNLMINDLDLIQWDYLLSPEFEMVNSAGKPLTGGYIEVYIHGTRNKYYCASDFTGTLHPFQIPLDSIGSNVILASPENAYDVYVYNKFGSLIMSRYNVHCQGGNGGPSTYVGDKLFYGQYRASNVTTIANLSRNKGNINLTSNGYLKLKNGMSYHITVRGAFQVDDVTNTDTTLNYIEYTSVNPIKIDIDETKEGPQYFELSYDIYRLPEDMDYQVAFAQSNGMVTDLLVEVHSLSNLATSSAGGDQEYEPGWGIDITNNVISVDPSILEALEYTAGDYISIVDNTISVTGIDPNSYATHDEVNNVSGVLHEEITNNIESVIETINNVSGVLHEEIIETAQVITGLIPTDYTTHEEVNDAIVTAIDLVTGMIPDAQIQSDWNQSDDTQPDYIKNKPDLDIYATHDEVNTVSGQIIETVNNVSGDIISTVNNVSGDIIETVNNVSAILHGEIENIPEQQQADWDQTDDTKVDYIKNKPDLSIYATHDEVTDAVTSIDLSEYATHTEVYDSSVTAIQLVTGLIPDVSDFTTHEDVHESIVTAIEYVTGIIPDAQVQSDWDETDTSDPSYIQNKPDLDIYVTHDELIEVVSAVTGIGDYGQFYSTAVSGAAIMARTKGTIDVTNDGKIQLKKGSSYHVTVRGRYNQTTPNNVYSNISYIEYITFNNININVDKSITESQYFEISYDLYKLNSDTDYYIFFSGLEGTVNDLFIEIHAIGSVGAGVSGGAGAEYDAGWGIQILNNVISVDPSIFNDYVTENELVTAIQAVVTAIPSEQVQSDWTEDDTSDPAYIQNKPDNYDVVAGQNIGIIVSGSELIIAASGNDLSDYATDAEVNSAIVTAINYVTGIIPDAQVQSDWNQTNSTQPDYIKNKPTIPSIDGLATIEQVSAVSGYLQSEIDNIPTANPQVQSDWTEDDTAEPSYIKHKPEEYDLVAGQNIGIDVVNNSIVISSNIGPITGFATEAEVYNAVVTGVQAATGVIPDSEEVQFEELDITQFAQASAIPTIELNGSDQVTGIDGHAIAVGSFTQVQSNWNESDNTSPAYIQNKPDIPTIQLNGDDQVTAINNHEIAGTGGTTYTAGDYIDITDDTISVTGLDNSNIFWAIYNVTQIDEIDAAYKAGKYILCVEDHGVLMLGSTSRSSGGNIVGAAFYRIIDLGTTSDYIQYVYVYKSNNTTIWTSRNILSDCQSDWNNNNSSSIKYIKNKPSIPTIQLNGDDQVTAIDGHTLAGGGGGGTTYTAGDYISIANDVISVTGVAPATAIPETEEVEFEELDLSNYALASAIPAAQVNSDWNANSGVAEILNKPTEIQLIAGTNVQIEVSGVSAVISAQGGGGGGSSYTAGDFIDITNNVISVDDTSNVVAGDGINITQSGNNTTISLGVTAGITDIQLVNSLPASPTSTVLYLIPET